MPRQVPGRGHLFVIGPTLDYVPVATTLRELEGGHPGSFRYYPHAVVPLNLKAKAEGPEVGVQLQRGVTLRGKVVGVDGKPAERFIVLCREYLPSGWHQWNTFANWLEGRNGEFELPGSDPDKPVTAYFLDEEHQMGATAQLSARPREAEASAVQLEPCGKAVVVAVESEGKPPVPFPSFGVQFQFDPGIMEYCAFTRTEDYNRPLEANWFVLNAHAAGKDSKNLIPGATFAMMSYPEASFTARSGETVKVTVHVKPFSPRPEKK